MEHACRVANLAKQIAENEGYPVLYAVIAGLLHDIDCSYHQQRHPLKR